MKGLVLKMMREIKKVQYLYEVPAGRLSLEEKKHEFRIFKNLRNIHSITKTIYLTSVKKHCFNINPIFSDF